MDRSTEDAVLILGGLADECYKAQKWGAVVQLSHAIRHLVRPERDVYPKVRNSRKRRPTTRDGAYRWER